MSPKGPEAKSLVSGNQWLLIGILVAVLALILAVLRAFPPSEYINNEAINEWVVRHSWRGVVVFFAAGSLMIAVGLPRQLVAFSSGYLFGNILGASLGVAAASTGCLLCFFASRHFLQSWVRNRYAAAVTTLDRFIEHDAFWKIVILRLQPFGTNLVTNLSAGLTRIPGTVFISSSVLGYIPQTVVFALMGSGIRVNSKAQMTVSSGLFVLSLLIGLYLYKKSLFNKT